MKKNQTGIFCISLDFELYWGIQDKKTIAQYGKNVLGAWEVVPRLLQVFKKYNIHATWAVVGAMLAQNREDLLKLSPQIKPAYKDENLAPYTVLYTKLNEIEDQYLFGSTLVEQVKNTPNQELGTHSFSHYYCLEDGQNKESFLADLQAGLDMGKRAGFTAKAYIFPRHQLNQEYIKEFSTFGIETYRGTEAAWYHQPAKTGEEGVLKRAFRFADYFVPMFSQHTQKINEIKKDSLYEIRASRWLRPYSKKWKFLDGLKVWRIKRQMTHAAKYGRLFHLWFHPHDIGTDIDENFNYVHQILEHYVFLKTKYGFESLNFTEIKTHCDQLKTFQEGNR